MSEADRAAEQTTEQPEELSDDTLDQVVGGVQINGFSVVFPVGHSRPEARINWQGPTRVPEVGDWSIVHSVPPISSNASPRDFIGQHGKTIRRPARRK